MLCANSHFWTTKPLTPGIFPEGEVCKGFLYLLTDGVKTKNLLTGR